MKFSKRWLNNFFEGGLPDTQSASDALTFHAFEIDGVEQVNGDDVLDVKVTPNRGHDCLSHRGIAKELSAILEKPLKNDPFALDFDLSQKTDEVTVSIEDTELCPRYIAAYIKGVKVGPSPDWLKSALENLGQRSINNVVDATNMVMFNTGQPLHAFDARKIAELTRTERGTDADKIDILVRRAFPDERMTTLDGKNAELQGSMLVIAVAPHTSASDPHSSAVIGIAGVKGGMPSGITEDTTDIIIESANFNGASIRKTAAALKLRTDASQRFEQGLSPEFAAIGMRQIAKLITETMGGEVVGFVDVYPESQEKKVVSVTLEKINNVLGTALTAKEVEDVFKRLGFSYTEQGQGALKTATDVLIAGGFGVEPGKAKSSGTFIVEPPFERLDIQIPEDLIEEVGRIIGYDKIEPQQLPPLDRKPKINNNFYWSERVREFLVSKGFSEIYTSVFAEEGERIVLNKVDGVRPYLRDSLASGVQEALEKNKRNAEMLGLPDVRLFEIGTVWNKEDEELRLAVGVKGNKNSPKPETLLKELLSVCEASHSNVLQNIGIRILESVAEIDLREVIDRLPEPTEYEKLPLSETERYQPFSRQPFIIRDVAFWVPNGTEPALVLKSIVGAAGTLCIKTFLLDRFEKNDRISLAYRLVFQSFDRTLTEEEVAPNMEAVYSILKDKGFEIR